MSAYKNLLHRERLFVGLYAFFVSTVIMHFTTLYYRGCCGESVILNTIGFPAPQAYRVAMPFLYSCIYRLHRFPGSNLYGVSDFVFTLLAVGLFYLLLAEQFRGLSASRRTARVALLLAFLLFPLFFVVPWGRPETLPSACYLALAMLCLEWTPRGRKWTILLLGATAIQSFVRSDVPFVFGIALCVLSVFTHKLEAYGTRSANMLRGGAVTALAAGIQCYLQFVRFPHLPYMTGSPIMAGYNLSPHIFWVAAIAIAPFAITAGLISFQRSRLRAAEVLILTSSVLFFPLWFAVGILLEVRIYVPFLMALCVVAGGSLETFLNDDNDHTGA